VKTTGLSRSRQAVDQNCCTKTVSDPQVSAVSDSKPANQKAVTVATFLPSAPHPLLSLPTVAQGRRSWDKDLPPPPTDLLTLLQRLLI
jgi:hypothetical protein